MTVTKKNNIVIFPFALILINIPSIQAFSVVFHVAIERADRAPEGDVKQRVVNLTECITYSVFQYTTRGLFECDKLIFTAQMAFQV